MFLLQLSCLLTEWLVPGARESQLIMIIHTILNFNIFIYYWRDEEVKVII